MSMTNETAQKLMAACAAGTKWALELKVGQKFEGCMPVARRLYGSDQEQDAFITGSYLVLKTMRIRTDMDGILVEACKGHTVADHNGRHVTMDGETEVITV